MDSPGNRTAALVVLADSSLAEPGPGSKTLLVAKQFLLVLNKFRLLLDMDQRRD